MASSQFNNLHPSDFTPEKPFLKRVIRNISASTTTNDPRNKQLSGDDGFNSEGAVVACWGRRRNCLSLACSQNTGIPSDLQVELWMSCLVTATEGRLKFPWEGGLRLPVAVVAAAAMEPRALNFDLKINMAMFNRRFHQTPLPGQDARC